MDFHRYRLADRSTHYEEEVAKHVAKRVCRLKVRMDSQLFGPWTRYQILDSCTPLRWPRDSNKANKGAIMRLPPFIIRRTAAAALKERFSLKDRLLNGSLKEDMLTSHVPFVNTLMGTYETDDIIAKADREIVSFTQPTNFSPLQCANALWMKTLCCPQEYEEYVLKETFMDGSLPLIRHGMHSFCSNNMYAALQKLAFKATSLTKVQKAVLGADALNSYQSPLTVIIRRPQRREKVTSRQYRPHPVEIR